MIVIGIDPSLTGTGIFIEYNDYAVVIKTKSSEDDANRMIKISKEIMRVINMYGNEDVKVGIEGFSMMSRGRGKGQLFGLGWVLRTKLKENNIPYIEIAPTMVKKFATGKGNCEKSLILKAVFKKWSFDVDDDNIADAYVIQKIADHYFNNIEPELSYEKEVMKKLRENGK